MNIYMLDIHPLLEYRYFKHLLSLCVFPFYSVKSFFWWTEELILMFYLSFFSLWFALFVFCLKHLCLLQGYFFMFSSANVVFLCFTYKSTIHLELIIVWGVKLGSRCNFFFSYCHNCIALFKENTIPSLSAPQCYFSHKSRTVHV